MLQFINGRLERVDGGRSLREKVESHLGAERAQGQPTRADTTVTDTPEASAVTPEPVTPGSEGHIPSPGAEWQPPELPRGAHVRSPRSPAQRTGVDGTHERARQTKPGADTALAHSTAERGGERWASTPHTDFHGVHTQGPDSPHRRRTHQDTPANQRRKKRDLAAMIARSYPNLDINGDGVVEMVPQLGNAPDIAGPTKLVEGDLRAGVRCSAPGSDLIVLGDVKAGADVVADGNIHIYGTLRGRAHAGARGNNQARLFVHRLEAALVAVNGAYLDGGAVESLECFGRGSCIRKDPDSQTIIASPLDKTALSGAGAQPDDRGTQ